MLGAAMMELSTYIRDIMDNKEKNMGDILMNIFKGVGIDMDRLESQYWCQLSQ